MAWLETLAAGTSPFPEAPGETRGQPHRQTPPTTTGRNESRRKVADLVVNEITSWCRQTGLKSLFDRSRTDTGADYTSAATRQGLLITE